IRVWLVSQSATNSPRSLCVPVRAQEYMRAREPVPAIAYLRGVVLFTQSMVNAFPREQQGGPPRSSRVTVCHRRPQWEAFTVLHPAVISTNTARVGAGQMLFCRRKRRS